MACSVTSSVPRQRLDNILEQAHVEATRNSAPVTSVSSVVSLLPVSDVADTTSAPGLPGVRKFYKVCLAQNSGLFQRKRSNLQRVYRNFLCQSLSMIASTCG